MQTTALNPTQIHLLKMFEVDDTPSGLDELKRVLYAYYSAKMEEQLEEMWQSGELSKERLDEISHLDLHKLD